jgi:hypothetical protein
LWAPRQVALPLHSLLKKPALDRWEVGRFSKTNFINTLHWLSAEKHLRKAEFGLVQVKKIRKDEKDKASIDKE